MGELSPAVPHTSASLSGEGTASFPCSSSPRSHTAAGSAVKPDGILHALGAHKPVAMDGFTQPQISFLLEGNLELVQLSSSF